MIARQDVPHFASSAMDGWAVAGPGPWAPVESASLRTGEARAISTGALIPDGARAVLRSEHGTVAADGTLRPTSDAPADEPWDGQHIRVAGQEARAGETVIPPGRLLNPAHLALAALCGQDELEVVRRPAVAFVLTGDEVDTRGVPAPGRVRDAFGPQLPALVASLGAVTSSNVRIGDDLGETIRALADGSRVAELVISTGGTGLSGADHLRAALSELGATIIIDRIAMRPGGPTVLARAGNGSFFLALPGNPLAAMTAMLTVAGPLISSLAGRPRDQLARVPAGEDIPGRSGSTLLIPYALEDGAARISAWRGSAMMRGLADADGVLVVRESGVRRGGVVDAIRLPWS